MNNSKPYRVLFLWLFLIYFPTYMLSNSNSKGQILFFVAYLFVLSVTYILLCKNKLLYIPKNEVISLFFVFSFILMTFFIKIADSSLGELINHSRFIFYLTVFVLTVNVFIYSSVTPLQIKKAISFTVFTFVVFNMLHLLSPKVINLINNRPIVGFRGISVGGPFVWSYIFSFCLIPMLYFYINTFTSRFTFKDLICIFFVIVFLLLGQSKSAYLALFFCSLNYLIISTYLGFANRRRIYSGVIFFSILILIVLIVFPNLFEGVTNGFSSLFEGNQDVSTSARVRQIGVAISAYNDASLSEFLFGMKTPTEVIENAFFSYLYKYGVIGFLCYISFYLFVLSSSYYYLITAVRRRYDIISMSIIIGFNSMVVALFFFSLGSSPIDANKSSFYFFFVWAVVIYIRKYNEKTS